MLPNRSQITTLPIARFARVLAAVAAALLTLAFAAPPPTSPTSPIVPSAQQPTTTTTPTAIPASRLAEHIAVITLDTKLDRFATASVIRRLDTAAKLGVQAIVLKINSRDSDFGTVSELLSALRASPVANTVAWIDRDATGGAALVALACREIVTSDAGYLGQAVDPDWLAVRARTRPRGPGNANPIPAPSTDIIASGLCTAIESARRFDRDEFLAQAIAVSGVELWLVENTTTGARLFINEREYRMLFTGEPPRQKPALAPGAMTPGLPFAAPPSAPPFPSSFWATATPRIDPASPGVDAVLAAQPQGTLTVESAPRRPVLSAADAGRWKLVEYATSGAGAANLHGGQLVDYGVATAVVRTPEELQAYFGAKKVTALEQSWPEVVARGLSNPVLRGFLITIFLVAMFIEMTHPGLVAPGAIAAVALLLLLGPVLAIGLASWWSLIAIGLGAILIALELFVIPGFGITGILGLLLLFTGLVFTFVPTGPAGMAFSTPEAQDALLHGVVTVILSAITAVFALFFVVRQLGTLPILQKYALRSPAPGEVDEALFATIPRDDDLLAIGDEGVAETPLRPAGKARFGEELVEVVSETGYIAEGSTVRITATDRFRTAVEHVAPPPAAPPDSTPRAT